MEKRAREGVGGVSREEGRGDYWPADEAGSPEFARSLLAQVIIDI